MNQSAKAPLFEALSSYQAREISSFHMPAIGLTPPCFSKLDVTELKTTDDLNDPTEHGPVKAAEALAARFFGAEQTRFLTEGSSQGIFAVMLALAGEGSAILLPRPIHRAFVFAAQRFSLNVYFAMTKHEKPSLSPLSYPDVEDYEAVLKQHPEIKMLVATAPDYYGHIVDLEGLERLSQKYHCLMFVDAAHSAHLHVLPQWRLYGDVQVMSAHKTLPAVTPAAYLHVKRADLAPRLDAALSVLRTSSPPLYVAAAADWARAFLETQGYEAFLWQNQALAALRSKLPSELAFLGPSGMPSVGSPLSRDPLRLVIDFSHFVSGDKAEAFLAEAGVQCEFSDFLRCVFIPSLLTVEKAYQRLASALVSLVSREDLHHSAKERETLRKQDKKHYARLSGLEAAPIKALSGLDLHAALLRSLAGNARLEDALEVAYPPGIPLYWPSELR